MSFRINYGTNSLLRCMCGSAVTSCLPFLIAILIYLVAEPILANTSPPNIVMILVDDQGWTGTSVQMDPSEPNSVSDFYQTPNIERLAEQGMRFSSAYASAPNCSPTRAAIQTGKSPAQLHMTDIPGPTLGAPFFSSGWYQSNYTGRATSPPGPRRELSRNDITIGEWIKMANPDYVTAHFGKWHLAAGGPGDHGYDFHDGPNQNAHGDSDDPMDPKRIFSVTQRANEFMVDRVVADKPFFIQISHYAVHTEIQTLQDTNYKYAHLDPGRRHTATKYAAMTENLDTGVGMLLNKIDELGIADNTYVIYVSDNGAEKEPSNNFPLVKNKASLWEGGIRVPMVVRGPNIHANSISDVPVTTTDLFPTISDLLGANTPLPEGLEGGSLRDVLENDGAGMVARSTEALFWHFPHYRFAGGPSPHSAVRSGDYKLIKLYETGELMLFNLAEDIREKEFNNLADVEPERRDRLHQMLNDWLDQVDGSIPYRVGDDIELAWNADHPGTQPDVWRATTDVQHQARESWDMRAHSSPQHVAIAPHQPHLPLHAFQFNGASLMMHKFFHVSDPNAPVPDNDHSASFEFWIRLDSLQKPHMIFETGRDDAGLSVTVGDADRDGEHDDLRFRAVGDDEQFIVLTTKLDLFADPTRDFVHLVAVFSDADTDRYAELYVNGALCGRVDAVDGEAGRINWDNWGRAGLGRTAEKMGGNSGGGDLPFSGGFSGELAAFRYFNHAIDGNIVQSAYNDMLEDVDAGITLTSGAALGPLERPSNVSGGVHEDDVAIVIHERNDTLDDPLRVDILPEPNGIYGSGDLILEGYLAAGTELTSYLVHFDPLGDPTSAQHVLGTVTFDKPIFGILVGQHSLHDTDVLLGTIGQYATGERALDLNEDDFLAISDDLRTLEFSLSAINDEVVQLRVVTANVPEPSSWVLLMGSGLALLRSRHRHPHPA